jgi:hypothetical protein
VSDIEQSEPAINPKEPVKYTNDECHKRFAVDYFNKTWDLLDKTERTLEEELNMIHAAHASRCHWGEVGTPLEYARGEWQVSRVYAVLNRGEAALIHALECLKLCHENGIGDFDIAFAHESVARAYAALGNKENFKTYYANAIEFGNKIAGKDDRDYFFNDLKTGAWFGMK